LGDKIEKNEMCGAYSTFGSQEMRKRFSRKDLGDRDNLEDLGL